MRPRKGQSSLIPHGPSPSLSCDERPQVRPRPCACVSAVRGPDLSAVWVQDQSRKAPQHTQVTEPRGPFKNMKLGEKQQKICVYLLLRLAEQRDAVWGVSGHSSASGKNELSSCTNINCRTVAKWKKCNYFNQLPCFFTGLERIWAAFNH